MDTFDSWEVSLNPDKLFVGLKVTSLWEYILDNIPIIQGMSQMGLSGLGLTDH